MSIKLFSWNVNGLRSVLGKGFAEFFDFHRPDILCLQEIKVFPHQIELLLPAGYEVFWNSAMRAGYAGTAVITRLKPLAASTGLGSSGDDPEGRLQTLEFERFYLVNVYTPNSKRDLSRLAYREREWDPAFLQHLLALERSKPVVFCGDFNVAHREIDLANPKSNRRNAGFTDEERKGFDNIVRAGFLDTFREFEKGGGHYTWWSYQSNARARNIGWRIDYWCISPLLRPCLRAAGIHPDIMGSDHCPVSIELDV